MTSAVALAPEKPPREQILSPSQWQKFADCFRAGGFKYIEKLPDPGSPQAQRGGRIHTGLESYLQGLIWTPANDIEGKVVHHMSSHLPPPGTAADLARRGIVIEGDITFQTQGVWYTGRKDLEWWEDFPAREGLNVTDYKSTSNFAYAHSRETLRKDVQQVIYSQHSFQKHPDQNELTATWLYGLVNKNVRTMPIPIRVTREDTDREMTRVTAFSKVILEAKEEAAHLLTLGKKKDINDLPYDESKKTCEKFGGCPFKSSCGAWGGTSARDRIRAAFRFSLRKGSTMAEQTTRMTRDEMLAKIKANQDRAKGAAPAAAPVASAPAVAQPAQQPPPAHVPPQGRTFAAPPPSPGHSGVVPASVPGAPVAVPGEAKAFAGVAIQAGATTLAQTSPEMAAEVVDVQKTPAEIIGLKVTPAKRGRPKKVTHDVSPSLEAEDKEDRASADRFIATQGIRYPADANPTATSYGFTLYVNCMPSTGGVLLSSLLGPIHAAIAEREKVAHYAMIEFGKGRGVFAEALGQYLDENPLPVALIVDSRSPEGADALATLEQRAANIVRGF